MNLRFANAILFLLLSMAPFSARSASLKVQGLCASQARAAFESKGWAANATASFVDHYDDASNKCFAAFKSVAVKGKITWTSIFVTDANDGTVYANNMGRDSKPFVCNVRTVSGKLLICHSNDEFYKLIHSQFGLIQN